MDNFDEYLLETEAEKRAQRREVWIGMLEAALAFWPALGLLILGFNAPEAVRSFFALVVSHG